MSQPIPHDTPLRFPLNSLRGIKWNSGKQSLVLRTGGIWDPSWPVWFNWPSESWISMLGFGMETALGPRDGWTMLLAEADAHSVAGESPFLFVVARLRILFSLRGVWLRVLLQLRVLQTPIWFPNNQWIISRQFVGSVVFRHPSLMISIWQLWSSKRIFRLKSGSLSYPSTLVGAGICAKKGPCNSWRTRLDFMIWKVTQSLNWAEHLTFVAGNAEIYRKRTWCKSVVIAIVVSFWGGYRDLDFQVM